jgi:hypothetical protein
MKDIKLKDAVLRWNVGGPIVVTENKPCEHSHLKRTLWSCESCWVRMSKNKRVSIMLMDVWSAVIRDGINPIEAHKALSVIPEYRDSLAEDVPV